MGTKHIKVTDNSEPVVTPVRRRNQQGSNTIGIAITIPNELNQTINGIVVKTKKSRSLIISELIAKGLNQHE